MQKWDYKMIYVHNGIIKWWEDGRTLSGQPNPFQKAKELGPEGWELIAIESSSQISTYWFKKPMP